MIFNIYAIYDSAIKTWRPPVYARNKGEILRSFVDAVNNPSSDFGKHPSDYTLFELGTWNDDNSNFVLHKTPISLGLAIEYVKEKIVAPSGSEPIQAGDPKMIYPHG